MGPVSNDCVTTRLIIGLLLLGCCRLYCQQTEIQLFVRPAKAIFRLGEPIEIEVACVTSVQNKYRDTCGGAYVSAKSSDDVRDISNDIPTAWIETLLHPCSGGGVGSSVCTGSGFSPFITRIPHWSKTPLSIATHIGRAGTFAVIAEYELPLPDGTKLPLQAETEVSIVDDAAWTRQQLADILAKLPSTRKAQQPALFHPLRELEGDDVLHTVIDLFTNDHSPEERELQLAIENAQNRHLALQLLENRVLDRDFNLDMDIVKTMTALAMRITDPDAFATETASWPKTVRSKSLEANAMLYLHDAVLQLTHHSYLDLNRKVALAEILQQLTDQRCDHTAGPLSASEIAALAVELEK